MTDDQKALPVDKLLIEAINEIKAEIDPDSNGDTEDDGYLRGEYLP